MVFIVLSSLFATAQEFKTDSIFIALPTGERVLKFNSKDSLEYNLNRVNRIYRTNKLSVFYYMTSGQLFRCRYKISPVEQEILESI